MPIMASLSVIDHLRLLRTPNIGPITYSFLIARYGTAAEAIKAIPKLSKRQGRNLRVASPSEAEKIIEQADKAGATILIKGHDPYPEALNRFDDAPIALFAKGHISLCNKPSIGIVGARNASINAVNLTASWAQQLGEAGFIITSGIARGIDRAAHIGALPTGTIGVSGCGIDIIYPTENTDLYEKIAEQGLILTEMVPGTKPSPHAFPARNRIIASLTRGIIVSEAAQKSGSLITAREMADRGGEVMAIPGAPYDDRAAGCNQLIKEGSHLIQSVTDILEIMQSPIKEALPLHPTIHNQDLSHLDDNIVRDMTDEIMKNVTFTPVDIDELTRRCHVSAQLIQVALLELELSGLVIRLSGNRVCKHLEIK